MEFSPVYRNTSWALVDSTRCAYRNVQVELFGEVLSLPHWLPGRGKQIRGHARCERPEKGLGVTHVSGVEPLNLIRSIVVAVSWPLCVVNLLPAGSRVDPREKLLQQTRGELWR